MDPGVGAVDDEDGPRAVGIDADVVHVDRALERDVLPRPSLVAAELHLRGGTQGSHLRNHDEPPVVTELVDVRALEDLRPGGARVAREERVDDLRVAREVLADVSGGEDHPRRGRLRIHRTQTGLPRASLPVRRAVQVKLAIVGVAGDGFTGDVDGGGLHRLPRAAAVEGDARLDEILGRPARHPSGLTNASLAIWLAMYTPSIPSTLMKSTAPPKYRLRRKEIEYSCPDASELYTLPIGAALRRILLVVIHRDEICPVASLVPVEDGEPALAKPHGEARALEVATAVGGDAKRDVRPFERVFILLRTRRDTPRSR